MLEIQQHWMSRWYSKGDEGDVVVGSMLRAYRDKDDLTKDMTLNTKVKSITRITLLSQRLCRCNRWFADRSHQWAQGSVLVLQQEIEQLSQLQDTGKWVYGGTGATSPRQFTLSTNQSIPATTWADAVKIIVDETDVGMGNHSFDAWEEDDTIEIAVQPNKHLRSIHAGSCWCSNWFCFKRITWRSRGLPVSNAEYEIRVFKLESGIDLDTFDERYVSQTGDTMSGPLETTRPIWIRLAQELLKALTICWWSTKSIWTWRWSIARFQQDEDVIKVQVDRVTSFQDNRVEKVGDPTQDKDAANKEYVDTKVKKEGDTMTGLAVTGNKTDGSADIDWSRRSSCW